jgi:hypothetical protein
MSMVRVLSSAMLSSDGDDYALDRTERLEQELAQLKEELRKAGRRVPAMLTPVARSTSNINDRLQCRRHLEGRGGHATHRRHLRPPQYGLS